MCCIENCVLCFSKSVLWNWKLSQRLIISVWFCRFGVCFCCLSDSFQKLCDKERFCVEAAEKHSNRNVFGAIRVNQATDLFLHSFIHYCTAHTLLSFVVAGRYGWDVFPSFSDPGQPFSATVRTYRVHIEISISSVLRTYVTLEHKTSHKGQFFEIEINTSSESWVNNISIDVWFVMIGQYWLRYNYL